jgi:hypothetical protein
MYSPLPPLKLYCYYSLFLYIAGADLQSVPPSMKAWISSMTNQIRAIMRFLSYRKEQKGEAFTKNLCDLCG